MAATGMLGVLAGVPQATPPIWMMRQAGRYLPEYREIRARARDFLDFCYTPDLAIEATLQPIRRFRFDAAIIFSDILVVPDALGRQVRFVEGEGPRLEPLTRTADVESLPQLDMQRLTPTLEALRGARAALPADIALLGFCGAPWTVATYMIAGEGTKDQAPARLWAYREPENFALLIDRLVDCSITYLSAQLDAGADAVQVFDSWAGVLPMAEFRKWSIEPMRRIVAGVRAQHPGARIIGFPRGASEAGLLEYASSVDIDAMSLDTTVDPAWAAKALQPGRPMQGNLDPLCLLAGGEALDRAVDSICGALAGQGFVFNLGHGILPPTPIAHVERMLERVRSGVWRRAAAA